MTERTLACPMIYSEWELFLSYRCVIATGFYSIFQATRGWEFSQTFRLTGASIFLAPDDRNGARKFIEVFSLNSASKSDLQTGLITAMLICLFYADIVITRAWFAPTSAVPRHLAFPNAYKVNPAPSDVERFFTTPECLHNQR